mmetsp:Transcript_27287/g.39523  ORF Transcript_27287/g.39523 Transcript_27287/m.39523 type:complete len:81 (-) Transcript_27287:2455-2697(-)
MFISFCIPNVAYCALRDVGHVLGIYEYNSRLIVFVYIIMDVNFKNKLLSNNNNNIHNPLTTYMHACMRAHTQKQLSQIYI